MRRPRGTPQVDSGGADAPSARSASDNDANAFAQKIADELKPHYQALLNKAHKTESDAYSLAYGRAVAQVAKARGTSEAKTKFMFRDVLQSIMNRVSA